MCVCVCVFVFRSVVYCLGQFRFINSPLVVIKGRLDWELWSVFMSCVKSRVSSFCFAGFSLLKLHGLVFCVWPSWWFLSGWDLMNWWNKKFWVHCKNMQLPPEEAGQQRALLQQVNTEGARMKQERKCLHSDWVNLDLLNTGLFWSTTMWYDETSLKNTINIH